MQKKSSIFINLVYLFSILTFGALVYLLTRYSFLPTNYMLITVVGLGIFLILAGLAIIFQAPKSKFVYIALTVLLLLLSGIQAVGAYYIYNTFNKLDTQGQKSEQVTYAVITSIDSKFDSVTEIGESTVQFSSEISEKSLEEAKGSLLKANDKLRFTKRGTYSELYKWVIEKKVNFVLFDLSRINIFEENREEFEKKVKILKLTSENETLQVLKDKDSEVEAKNVDTGNSFNVYISGSDSYTGLYDVSRSDVNIIMTVNPKTKKILLTTIPRDSYVYMPGYGNDKLTHSGIYGIQTSIDTLENLLETEINYYAKVNFTSVIDIVDTLGGITVQNPNNFSTISGEYFSEGDIYLNGNQTLAFVRERKNLPDGDLDRGRNHMRVMNAIIKKLISFETIANYNNVLDSLINSINTNIPSDKITELINLQIESGSGWEIDTNEVSGWEAFGLPSFAMPDHQLYMYQLDDLSVLKAIDNINNLVEN